MKKRVLIVGGSFDNEGGRFSGVIRSIGDAAFRYSGSDELSVTTVNGGHYDLLKPLLETTGSYDCVFWFANVPNEFEKVRDVKSVAPKVMLVSSKRNDNAKYTFEELLQRALAVKANLCFEFSKKSKSGQYHIRVFDPLGCVWYDGDDIEQATWKALERISVLSRITRQGTKRVPDDNVGEISVSLDTPSEAESAFLDVVHQFAEVMQEVMPLPPDAVRFLGNASEKKEILTPWRCSKGFPSFRAHDDVVFVSRRNVPKQFIEAKDFVPVFLDDDTGTLWYWGDNKPSVDTPVQTRLYRSLPKIRYMIHSHCYLDGVPTTVYPLPCGAVEEANMVLGLLRDAFGSLELDTYAVNLKGHGCIVMADTPDKLLAYKDKLYARPTPESYVR